MKNLLLALFVVAFASVANADIVKKPNVAGQFYPGDRGTLSSDIEAYLKPYKLIGGEGALISIIVPHAGYQYSGIVAGYAYKQLTNKSYDTVIIAGPSHYGQFDGLSVIPSGEYETPLGRVKIDAEMVLNMMAFNPKIKSEPSLWDKEHSVEVQIPFLQKTLRNFKIVPVIFGSQSLENCSILAEAIVKSMGKKRVLIVASSDLSHYHTAETANIMDAGVIDAISKGDINKLAEKLASGECEMCGYGPVIAAMMASDALGANSYEILKYGDSGDITGDKTSVVGYLSAAIYKRPLVLDDTERTRLLEIARKTLESYLTAGAKPDFTVYEKNLMQKAGVFVTLNKGEQLRGCVGYIRPYKPLYLAVSDMAIAAATEDARFTPVASEELKDIKIEISVLSDLTKISDLKEITIGKHGLFIVNGGRSGLLLPQVATDNKWTVEQFLENVCAKAGLPVSALKESNTQLYVFTADVFKEED